MGIFDLIGKIVVGIIAVVLVVSMLAYFGIIEPSTPSPATIQNPQQNIESNSYPTAINDMFEDVGIAVGRFIVYLQSTRYEEATQSLLDAKLKISDIKVKLISSDMSTSDKEDLLLLTTAYDKLIEGSEHLVEVQRTASRKDFLTLTPYQNYVSQYIQARNDYADFYNTASGIKNAQLQASLNLTTYYSLINMLDKKIADLEDKNMMKFVYANTFISKIEPTNQDVRLVASDIERETGTDASARLIGILTYFSDNMKYVHIPNWNPENSVQYIQSPSTSISIKGGNCADLSILFDSIAESIGLQTQFCLVDTSHTKEQVANDPSLFSSDHSSVNVFNGEQWLYYDVTCYAGSSIATGDNCNEQSFNYASECYDVEKFFNATKISTTN